MPKDNDYKGKNLVVCCDGTDNEFGVDNTNVVRLLSLTLKQDEEQVVFYEPGLGTFPAPGAITPLLKWVTKKLGSAFGYGLSQNLAVCYQFLVENYKPGDRIYLFGFSRGAYTARALAALIHVCGLMRTKNYNLVPYAIKLFESEASNAKKHNDKEELRTGKRHSLKLSVCDEFKRVFSTSPGIHFLGVWDTVSSIGSIFDPYNLPHTRWNPSVKTVRHAISIDEMRKFFRTNPWSDSKKQCTDVKQVWFAGVHADIGGGYKESESGLAKVTLQWMLDEARAAGLVIDEAQLPTVFPADAKDSTLSRPDAGAKIHNELESFFWKLMQCVPRRYWTRDEATGKFIRRWDWSFSPLLRPISKDADIHPSVFERIEKDSDYNPVNLPTK